MAHRQKLQLALLCILAVSGCVSKSRFNSGVSMTPFSKKASAYTAPKQPLTQFALKSLKPHKTPVKIVSPLDWFRSSTDTSNVATQLSADQMANLSEKYEAALNARTGQPSSSLASPQAVDSPFVDLARAKAMSGPAVPSYAAAPSTPQYSPASPTTYATATASQFAAPQRVQLQSAQLPLTQPPTAPSLTASFNAPTVSQPTFSRQSRMSQTIYPQPVQTNFSQPSSPTNLAATQYATAAANISPLTYRATTSSPTYPPFNQPMNYPSTSQQPLPNLSTTTAPDITPTYR